jgi:hypothetical protein
VNVRRRKQAVLFVRLEDAELHQSAYMLERARDELGELLRRDLGHVLTLRFRDRAGGRVRLAACAGS